MGFLCQASPCQITLTSTSPLAFVDMDNKRRLKSERCDPNSCTPLRGVEAVFRVCELREFSRAAQPGSQFAHRRPAVRKFCLQHPKLGGHTRRKPLIFAGLYMLRVRLRLFDSAMGQAICQSLSFNRAGGFILV